MFHISRDNPAYYLTSVAHNRLPVFQTDEIKQIVCNAFDEARRSGKIMIFAYVIMPDHMPSANRQQPRDRRCVALSKRHFCQKDHRASKGKQVRKLAFETSHSGARKTAQTFRLRASSRSE